MKNMFGVVPGARYGWPKNILHWNVIQESILDLCATVPIRFVIADGAVAMEGGGPLNGTARPLGKIVVSFDTFLHCEPRLLVLRRELSWFAELFGSSGRHRTGLVGHLAPNAHDHDA